MSFSHKYVISMQMSTPRGPFAGLWNFSSAQLSHFWYFVPWTLSALVLKDSSAPSLQIRKLAGLCLDSPFLCYVLETLLNQYANVTVGLTLFSVSQGTLSFITWYSMSSLLLHIVCPLFVALGTEVSGSLLFHLDWKNKSLLLCIRISYRVPELLVSDSILLNSYTAVLLPS